MTDELPEVNFRGWQCRIEEQRYHNGGLALELVDKEDGERVAMATVNVEGVELAPNEVLIKNYGEHAPAEGQPGMLETLERAGIVERTGEWVETGYVRVPKCRVLGR